MGDDLLERDGELAALRDATRDAAAGRGSVVLIAGEAGIGKSSLLRAWVAEPGHEARVLMGWCDDFLTSRTLGPFHDIARASGGPLAEAVVASDTTAVLEALLAELANPLRPSLLVLEDLHWADEATLDVVRYVGRRIQRLPAVLAVTYRDDEVGIGHPMRSVVAALAPTSVRRIGPHRLSRNAVAALAATSELDPDEVLAVTSGNPFFVTEVIQAGAGVPASVADAVLARVRDLAPGPRAAVELLSLMPRPRTPAEVTALGCTTDDLAAAEERGLLQVREGAVRFRHELARQAIANALPATTRLALHERLVEHLLERDDDRAALLHHATECHRADVIVAHGPAAAHAAFRAGAHREALLHQRRVLAHAGGLAPGDRAALLEEHAWTLYNLHRFDEAAAAADQALTLREAAADAHLTVRSLLTAARMAYMINQPDRCFALIEVASQLVADLDHHGLAAAVAVSRAAMRFLADMYEGAIADADRATSLVSASDAPEVHVLAGVYRGGARFSLGDEAGLEEMWEAISLGRRSGQIEATARGYTNVVEFLVAGRRWEQAEAAIAEAIDFYDDHDLSAHRYNTVGQKAQIHVLRGDWAEARRLLAGLRGSDAQAGILGSIEAGLRVLLDLRSGEGGVEDDLERLWEVVEQTSGSVWHVAPAACAALELAWLRSDPSLADPYVAPALEASAGTTWRGWILWRLALLGRDVTVDEHVVGPERASLTSGWAAGAAAWRELGMPYEEAVELLRSNDADAVLRALEILDGLGAEPAARLARARLRDLGVRSVPRGPQATTRENPAGLTDRQLEVVQLLAEGLTNAQMAERLVVSVRTVDHHVAAVLAKLGVSNRHEAAERAVALGVAPADAP